MVARRSHARNAPSPSAPVSASTAARPAPAARTAAGHDPADIDVSGSIVPPPCSARASSCSTCRGVCTRVISSAVASRSGSGLTRASVSAPTSRAAWSIPACTASSRAGRSGCPRPGSWSAKRGSTPTNSTITPFAVASSDFASTVGKAAVTAAHGTRRVFPADGRRARRGADGYARASPCRP